MKQNTPFSIILVMVLISGCSPILSQQKLQSNRQPVESATPAQPAKKKVVTPTYKVTPGSGALLIEMKPGTPRGIPQVIHDQVCRQTAAEKKAPGGDEFTNGRFERPFDQNMNYIPSVDIEKAELVRPENGWAYFTIYLEETPAPPPAVYGIQLDLNIDGRGDYMITFHAPSSTTWVEDNIKMNWDSDGDVGGQIINRSDPKGFKGSGFESIKIDTAAGKNTVKIWIRLIDKGIQIAVHEDILGGKNPKFTWQPFAEGQAFPLSQFDLNDYYSTSIAGSAIAGDSNYPLKELFGIDNTCKGLSGLTPSGTEQGVCPS